jgi:hypothetical protein
LVDDGPTLWFVDDEINTKQTPPTHCLDLDGEKKVQVEESLNYRTLRISVNGSNLHCERVSFSKLAIRKMIHNLLEVANDWEVWVISKGDDLLGQGMTNDSKVKI